MQSLPTSIYELLHGRVRPHLIAQHAVYHNIPLVGIFVGGHGKVFSLKVESFFIPYWGAEWNGVN